MATPGPSAPTPASVRRAILRSAAINVVLPLVLVEVLLGRGVGPVLALALGAIFPAVDAVLGIVRERRVAPLAVLSLVAIVVGIGASFLTGSPVFALAKESLFTAIFGIVALGSLVAPRPLIFYLGKEFTPPGPDAPPWETRWASQPGFRHAMRVLTAVWGVGFLFEAAARVVVALTLPPAVAVVASPIIMLVTLGVLIAYTRAYAIRARKRYAAAA